MKIEFLRFSYVWKLISCGSWDVNELFVSAPQTMIEDWIGANKPPKKTQREENEEKLI